MANRQCETETDPRRILHFTRSFFGGLWLAFLWRNNSWNRSTLNDDLSGQNACSWPKSSQTGAPRTKTTRTRSFFVASRGKIFREIIHTQSLSGRSTKIPSNLPTFSARNTASFVTLWLTKVSWNLLDLTFCDDSLGSWPQISTSFGFSTFEFSFNFLKQLKQQPFCL